MINTFQNGEAVTIEKIVFNGYRIGIPIPFPMKYVYCYLFKQQDGYVLIDVGYNNKRGKTAWKEAFRELHMEPGEIKMIYLTHFHPDHAGLAGWMHQLTGAPIYMHRIDAKMMEHVWGENSSQSRNIKEMVIEHGAPQALACEIEKQMDVLVHHVQPIPAIHTISDQVVFANKEWKVIHTPGHSTGHICFFQEEERVLISGDHILEKITPNISVWPGASQTPLHDYINSLHRVEDLQARIAYTAHRSPIENVNERIKELLQHHEERLTSILELVQNRTAFEVAGDLFAHKELTPHQWRFAIAETIAHLDYLSIENRAEKIMGFPIKYEKSNE